MLTRGFIAKLLVLLSCVVVVVNEVSAIDAESALVTGAQSGGSGPQPSAIRQFIRGTKYENDTAHFTLTVPKDWFVSDILTKQLPGIVGALSAPGGSVAIMVQRYKVQEPKAAAHMLDSGFANNFRDYRKLTEGSLKIDERDSYSFVFRATFSTGSSDGHIEMPSKLLIVLIPDGEGVLGFTCQSPEGEFDRSKPIFDSIVTSFRSKTP